MISRLLLVGMVGVLGISLPDGADLGMKLTWARTGATACACRRETVTFEPIAVGDDAINRIADELNRQAEGLDLPMVSTARVVAKDRTTVTATEDVVARMFAENQVWGEPAADAVVMKARPAAIATEDVVARMFAENDVWGEAAAPEARPTFEPIAVAEGGTSVADELNRAGEGIDLDPAAVTARAPRRPSFAPIAVVEGDSSLADELNRGSEGLTHSREPEPTVGTALRLTRDAALAWMNVLARTTATEGHTR